MTKKLLLYAALAGVIGWLSWRFPVRYTYADLKGYLDTLTNTSSMIFTIMGIWIAFLYPNALARLVNQEKIANADFSETLVETRRLEQIVAGVFKSGLVVLGCLAVALGKVLVGGTAAYASWASEVKSGVVALVVFLTYLQAEAVIAVLISNLTFINELHHRRVDRKMDQDA